MLKPFKVRLHIDTYHITFNEEQSRDSAAVRTENRHRVEDYLNSYLGVDKLRFVQRVLPQLRLSREAQVKLLKFIVYKLCNGKCPSFGQSALEASFRAYHKAIVTSLLMDWLMGREGYYCLSARNNPDWPDYVDFSTVDLTIKKKGWGTIKWI